MSETTTENVQENSTNDCDSPVIKRLEFVPHSVGYTLEDGDLRPTGYNESLLGVLGVEEKGRFFCASCDTEFETEEEAVAHLEGSA